MSKIALSGPAAGTATYTLTAPTGVTDRTIVLPDSNGTILTTATAGVPVNGPAFSAYPLAAQTIANATFTKIQVNTELFDTNSNFDVSNYRFTPTVAGYYQVTGCWYSSGTTGQAISTIYKNGANYQNTSAPGTVFSVTLSVVSFIYMNGSTDYLEFYVYQSSGSSVNTLGARADLNYFQAFLARSAT